ncbi:hypothetical protein VB834_05575 [Limnoraphis robusta Tam1]|uniref:hypothetical protein n=1 Tax=Limnoraphis robusta TaxID=1118279 RepID=UPI002B21F93B|nr:hypothetical protein [Limnoraphis robusta]MEA5496198.1 hypothetical protein [Limnoraphis robusta BA-68 BA1]MEA5538500.1 hypothetical protein [Limnoraphis robusta Tam1]
MTQRKLNNKACQSLREVDSQINSAILQSNERLKALGSKLTIQRRKNRLYLRGTLPCKPGETTPEGTKRYEISIASADLEGVRIAETKAIEITAQLKLGGFNWEMYGVKPKPKPQHRTMGEIKADFEENYWRDRPQTRKKLSTFRTSYDASFKKIPDLDCFTNKNIEAWICSTPPNSRTRASLIRVIKALAKQEGIEVKPYNCKPVPTPRILPTDTEIEMTFDLLPDDIAWSFGMIATYGLRTQEVFNGIEKHLKFFTSPDNELHKFRVEEDNKTGERLVYPLYPHWVERFDLLNPKPFPSNARNHESKVTRLGKILIAYGFKNEAYSLRHRYAIRAHELDIPIDDAARWMGHSVEMHVKTYQRYMDASTSDKIYRKLLSDKQEMNELNRLRLENQFLKDRVAELEEQLRR